MRVVIAGSRDIEDPAVVAAAITASGFTITEVVSGTARGVDRLAERWALCRGIPVLRFPAEWQRLGKRAGIVRNAAMIRCAASSREGAVIAVWNGTSPGTRHTIECARANGLPVYVHRV